MMDAKQHDLSSMLGALSWIDKSLLWPERRAAYKPDTESGRVLFPFPDTHEFEPHDGIRTDIAMARFFGNKIMVGDDGKLDEKIINKLAESKYSVISTIYIGNRLDSWIVVGQHFALEMRNTHPG